MPEVTQKQQNVASTITPSVLNDYVMNLAAKGGLLGNIDTQDESDKYIDDALKIVGKALKAQAARAAVRQLEEPPPERTQESPPEEPPKYLNVNELLIKTLERADHAVAARFQAEEKALELRNENKRAELDFTATVIKELMEMVRDREQQKQTAPPQPSPWQAFLQALPKELLAEVGASLIGVIKQNLTPRSPKEEMQAALQMIREWQDIAQTLTPKVPTTESTDREKIQAIIETKRLDLEMKKIDAELERWKENLRREDEERARRGERIDRLIESLGQLALGLVGTMMNRVPVQPTTAPTAEQNIPTFAGTLTEPEAPETNISEDGALDI